MILQMQWQPLRRSVNEEYQTPSPVSINEQSYLNRLIHRTKSVYKGISVGFAGIRQDRIVWYGSHHHRTGWTDLATRRQSHMCLLTYKTVTGDGPSYPMNMIVSASTSAYRMRSNMRNSLDVPRTLNRTGDLAFSVAAPRLWKTFNQDLLNTKISRLSVT